METLAPTVNIRRKSRRNSATYNQADLEKEMLAPKTLPKMGKKNSCQDIINPINNQQKQDLQPNFGVIYEEESPIIIQNPYAVPDLKLI